MLLKCLLLAVTGCLSFRLSCDVFEMFLCVCVCLCDNTDETILLCFFFCSEGVFKCPEDQLPLDYAKVRDSRL